MLPILRIVPVGGVLLAILILVLALTPPDGSRRSLSPSVVTARGPLIDREEHPEWRQFLIRAALQRADELSRLRDLPDTPMHTEPVAPQKSEPQDDVSVEPDAAPSETPGNDDAKPAENPQATDVQTENAQSETPPPALAQPESTPLAAAPADASEETPKLFAGLPAGRNSADPPPDDVTGSIDEQPGATIPIDIGEASSTELPVVLPEERPPVIRTPVRVKPSHESRRKRLRRVHQAKVATKPPPTPLGFFEILFGIGNPPQPPVPARKSARKSPEKSAPKIEPAYTLLPQIRAEAY